MPPHFSRPAAITAIMLAVMCAVGGALYLAGEAVEWRSFGVLTFFYAVVFFIGAYAGRYKKEGTNDDVLIAGRNIPLWMGVFTMAATWIDGTYINGTAEATASSGLIGVQAPWGYALSLIVGGLFFARPMRRGNFKTMLDPLEQRFGKLVATIGFFTALSGEVFWTAAVLTTLGMTFSTVIHLNFTVAVLISASVTVAYAVLGGLWAVAFTDVFQLLFLFLGLYFVLPFVATHTGGIAHTYAMYCAKMGTKANLLPPANAFWHAEWGNWWDTTFLLVLGGIPWQVYFQRVLSARSERAAVWLSVGAGVLCLCASVPPAVMGMIGNLTDWQAIGVTPPENAALILPYVIKYLAPPALATVVLAVVAAAVMASTDASMVSVSSLWTWNVYARQINPAATPAQLARVMRRTLVVVGTTGMVLAISFRSVYVLWVLCSDLVYCFLFPLLVTALFDKRAHRIGALCGIGVAAVLRIGGGEPSLGIPALLSYPVGFPFKTVAMLAGLATIMIVSRMTKNSMKSEV